jgi:hypothetical protein
MLEDNITRNIFAGQTEKTFIDKIFAKEDVEKIRDLIKKPKLTRSELLELLYLISANESKLVNYSEWDRYIALKFFVWIREFVKVAELLYDYKDDLIKKEERSKADPTKIQKFKISERSKQLLDNNERLIEHNAKFVIDLYLNMARTTLSLGATGFIETLKNKYEIAYPNNGSQVQATDEKKSIFSFMRSGK